VGTDWELVKVPSGGGAPERLAEAAPGGGDQTAWSPTGEWIAHVLEGSLRLTSAHDGRQRRLGGAPPPIVRAFGFSVDGAVIFAVRQHLRTATWDLAEFDVPTGAERRVVKLDLPARATLSGFSLSPGGRAFASSIGIARRDVWLLEGLEPPASWLSRVFKTR
jgi:hypothetical protein